jgi:hypothetical protein
LKKVQIPKWNKLLYNKRDIWIKDDNTTYKRVEQKYGKQESNRNPGNKSPFSQTKAKVED